MPNTRQYEYTPEKLEVSPSFYTTMKEREKLKISAEAVLTMYANSADKKLDRLSPMQFMKNYAAYTWKTDNRTGLENGMVYEMYLEQVVHDMLVFVDPNPFLIEKINSDDRLRSKNIRLVFSDLKHVRIYKREKLPKSIGVYHLDDFHIESDCAILLFAQPQSKKYVLQNLTCLRNAIGDSLNTTIHVLLPTSYVDPGKAQDCIRNSILGLYDIHSIYAIESGVTKGGLKRKCLFSMTAHHTAHAELEVRKVALIQSEDGAFLEVLEKQEVSSDEFASCDRTILQLYNDSQKEGAEHKSRTPAKSLHLCLEITFEYSSYWKGKKLRGSERYQGFVIKGGEGYIQRKKECFFSEEKRPYATQEEFEDHIWHIPFINENFQRTFIRSVRNMEAYELLQKKTAQKAAKGDIQCVGDTLGVQALKPLSMMGFYLYFFCNPDAPFTGRSLDRELCEKMFTGIGPEANEIRALILGESQDSDILDAIQNYIAIHATSEEDAEDVWRQFNLILTCAVNNRYMDVNPVQVYLDSNRGAKRLLASAVKNWRSRMADKTLTEAQESALFRHLLAEKTENRRKAVAMLTRIIYGLSIGVVCALNWDDYQPVPQYDLRVLRVYKRLEEHGIKAVPMLRPTQMRQIPLVELLISILDEMQNEDVSLLEQFKIERKHLKDYPIFHDDTDPTRPLTVEKLRKYEHELMEQFGPESLVMSLVDGQGGTITKDMGRYYGDFFVENFKYQARLCAGLDLEEITYIMGYVPNSTLLRSYVEMSKPTHLTKIRQRINEWVWIRAGLDTPLDKAMHTATLGTKRSKTISTTPTSFPTETVAYISAPIGEGTLIIEADAEYGIDLGIELL